MDFKTTVSGRGYGFYPKRCVDVTKCELMRGLKLTDNTVETISFIAPRKVGILYRKVIYLFDFSLSLSKLICTQIATQKYLLKMQRVGSVAIMLHPTRNQ